MCGGRGSELGSGHWERFHPSSPRAYLGFCTLGISPICIGKSVPSWSQATYKVNATDELVCRPDMDAGVWIGEKMEILRDKLRRKKASSEQESEHNLCPGPRRSCHWFPLIESDSHLLFKIACGHSDAPEESRLGLPWDVNVCAFVLLFPQGDGSEMLGNEQQVSTCCHMGPSVCVCVRARGYVCCSW